MYNNPNNLGGNNGMYNNPNNFAGNNGMHRNPNNFGGNNDMHRNPNNFGGNNGRHHGHNNSNNNNEMKKKTKFKPTKRPHRNNKPAKDNQDIIDQNDNLLDDIDTKVDTTIDNDWEDTDTTTLSHNADPTTTSKTTIIADTEK